MYGHIEPQLQQASMMLRGASGEGLVVLGAILVKGFFVSIKVQFRAEQQAFALRERLHISVVDVRPTGAEVVFDHFVAKSLLATSVISAVVARSKYPHSSDKAPSDVTGFLERVLMRNRTHDDKQPRFLVGWSPGHRDARHHHLDVRFECHTPRPVEVRSSTKQ